MTGSRKVLNSDARRFPIVKQIQAIITSPPYMNELDYVRDNRLRLWFIDKAIPQQLECCALKRKEAFGALVNTVFGRLAEGVRVGGHIALILGDVRRGARRVDCAKIAVRSFRDNPAFRSFQLIHTSTNAIPDIRRSRRDCEGTKKETLVILQRR
jgi:tRNA G10  N-methylase Trm11